MLTFLLFSVLCILGETEGQNCTFPCNWQNKDFNWWVWNHEIGFWNFSEATYIYDVQGGSTGTYECFNIVGRFVIVRDQHSGHLRCYVIDTTTADSFAVIGGDFFFASDFTNECSVCSDPTGSIWRLSAVGTDAQNQTRAECNIPVGCTPGLKAVDPIICDDKDNIEGDCNEATTHPTTPPPPTTSPAIPPPKHCKHGHP